MMIRICGFAALAAVVAVPTWAAEPKTVAVAKLPADIRKLHTCAKDGNVEMAQEKFAKSVLFFVSCPAKARGGLQLQAAYVARDAKGSRARRLSFEILDADGKPATADTVPSAIPAREAFVKEGDDPRHVQSRDDPPWISGAWGPEDRPGVCAIAANWRVQGDKAELWLWDEARECPRDALPKYESKLDKKPPALVAP